MILAVINIVQNGFSRAQRNLVLGADTAKQNANTQFVHNDTSLLIRKHSFTGTENIAGAYCQDHIAGLRQLA